VYDISASFPIYPPSVWESEPKGLSDPEIVSIPLHLRAINCFFFYSFKFLLDLNILLAINCSNEFLSLIMHYTNTFPIALNFLPDNLVWRAINLVSRELVNNHSLITFFHALHDVTEICHNLVFSRFFSALKSPSLFNWFSHGGYSVSLTYLTTFFFFHQTLPLLIPACLNWKDWNWRNTYKTFVFLHNMFSAFTSTSFLEFLPFW